jgi:hypothetical protein
MTRLDRSLSKVFGVPELGASAKEEPMEEQEFPVATVPENSVIVAEPNSDSDQIDEDTAYVKHKLKSLLANADEAFEVIVNVAKTEESPRAFEVVSTMMGQMKDIAMGILDAEAKRQKLKAGLGEEGQGQAQTVNNTQNNTTVFVGTTAEFQRMLDEEDAREAAMATVIDVEAKQQDEDSK